MCVGVCGSFLKCGEVGYRRLVSSINVELVSR